MSEFGQALQAHRNEKMLTRRELSERIGMKIRTLKSYELGERLPSLLQFHRLSDALRLTYREHMTLQNKLFSRHPLRPAGPPWMGFTEFGAPLGAGIFEDVNKETVEENIKQITEESDQDYDRTGGSGPGISRTAAPE